jgi:polysaccharide pyruvyl transferase WcaK-like protein
LLVEGNRKSVTGDRERAMRICLYVTIPEREEYRRHPRPLMARVKGAIKHCVNLLQSRLTGRLVLEDYHYMAMVGMADNCNRGDIAIRMAVREQLTAAFAPRPVEFIEVAWCDLNDAVVAQINRDCDLFVVGGGGYIFLNADGSLGDRSADWRLFAGLTIPVDLYGIGLNRLMHEEVRDVRNLPPDSQDKIARLGALCRNISVRDPDAQALFELYAKRTPALIGDPVLYLRSGAAHPAARSRPLIGINLAAHSWRAIAVLTPLLPGVVALLKDLQQKADLVYLLHHEMERPVLAHLRRQGLRLAVADGSPHDLLEQYAAADFVICQMLHSCIFAANAGTPFLNIAYDQKSLAFCSLMGVPECGIAHDRADAATLAAMFASLFERRAGLAAALEEHKQELHHAQQLFARKMAEPQAQLAG